VPPKRSNTIEAVLSGAELAFAERGFHGASIGYICQCAGKTTGAFYSNWDSKLQLFVEVYQRHTDDIAHDIGKRISGVDPRGDVTEQLAKVFTEVATAEFDQRWLSLNIEFRLLCLRDEEAAAALAEYEERFVRRLGDEVESLLARCAQRPALDGYQLVAIIGAMVRGIRLDHGIYAAGGGTDPLNRETVAAIMRNLFASSSV
jgi:AcrR family transcriptional regulator